MRCRRNSSSSTRRSAVVDPAGEAGAGALLQAFYAVRSDRQLMKQLHGTLIEAFASMNSFKPKDGAGDEPPARARGGIPRRLPR
jgi:hypothetical protein